MSIEKRFDLVVIGSGPAGEKGATQAAYHGKRVAIVERAPEPGGAAVSNAGIPTKALRETALYVSGFHKKEIYGVSLHLDPVQTFERLRTRSSAVSAAMSAAVRRNLERHGIELIRGSARLDAGRRVHVCSHDGSERVLDADAVLIATGSRPLRPPAIPFDDPDVVDSEGILALDRPFQSVAIVGAGAVGCEFASIFTALGIGVTLIDISDRALPFLDREISELLVEPFRAAGMDVRLGCRVGAVTRERAGLRVELDGGNVVRPDKLLFAAGRVGNTDGLGLRDAGVEVDERGRVVVDGHYRTTSECIYAAGDVIGAPALSSVSMEQARVAMCHAFDIRFKPAVDPVPPVAAYSIPEGASVGMTEEAARQAGVDYEVGRSWFADNARAVIAGATEGLVKLIFERDSHRLLGAHVISDEAGELIHQGQAVLNHGGRIDYFIHTTFGVPTRTEAYKYAAYDGLTPVERGPTGGVR